MKLAIFVTITLIVLLNLDKSQAELDSEEYDETGQQALTYDDDSESEQQDDQEDDDYRDARGLFKKKVTTHIIPLYYNVC